MHQHPPSLLIARIAAGGLTALLFGLVGGALTGRIEVPGALRSQVTPQERQAEVERERREERRREAMERAPEEEHAKRPEAPRERSARAEGPPPAERPPDNPRQNPPAGEAPPPSRPAPTPGAGTAGEAGTLQAGNRQPKPGQNATPPRPAGREALPLGATVALYRAPWDPDTDILHVGVSAGRDLEGLEARLAFAAPGIRRFTGDGLSPADNAPLLAGTRQAGQGATALYALPRGALDGETAVLAIRWTQSGAAPRGLERPVGRGDRVDLARAPREVRLGAAAGAALLKLAGDPSVAGYPWEAVLDLARDAQGPAPDPADLVRLVTLARDLLAPSPVGPVTTGENRDERLP
ncbi:MAG TPA: hypothetical protein VED40_22995 [Azospirillaceae bacterium]|nr:hypothetical protein [Azospirillaceae bacterium]